MKKVAGMLIILGATLPEATYATDFTPDELCKAAISIDMFRPVEIMETIKRGPLPEISYARDDGDEFLYRCKVVRNRIIWATYFTESKSWGRWREHTADPVLSFQVKKNELIVHSSETDISRKFMKSDF